VFEQNISFQKLLRMFSKCWGIFSINKV